MEASGQSKRTARILAWQVNPELIGFLCSFPGLFFPSGDAGIPERLWQLQLHSHKPDGQRVQGVPPHPSRSVGSRTPQGGARLTCWLLSASWVQVGCSGSLLLPGDLRGSQRIPEDPLICDPGAGDPVKVGSAGPEDPASSGAGPGSRSGFLAASTYTNSPFCCRGSVSSRHREGGALLQHSHHLL